jgi:hypothetical protein
MYSVTARSAAAKGATAAPRHSSLPLIGRVMPAAILNSVVLPLPLAPVTSSASPALNAKPIPVNSVAEPRCAASCWASSMKFHSGQRNLEL